MVTQGAGGKGLEIRVCDAADAPVVATLVAAFRDHLRATSPSDAQLVHFTSLCLDDVAQEFCCAWIDGVPAGYTLSRFFRSLWALGTEAFLDDLFVKETFRGCSVGRSLLRHAVARARERDARAMGLNTNDRNERAHRLYLSEGFQPQSHELWPEGREVRWVREFGPDPS